MMPILFEVHEAEEGGYYARVVGHSVFTEGATWEELWVNLVDAVNLHFEDDE